MPQRFDNPGGDREPREATKTTKPEKPEVDDATKLKRIRSLNGMRSPEESSGDNPSQPPQSPSAKRLHDHDRFLHRRGLDPLVDQFLEASSFKSRRHISL